MTPEHQLLVGWLRQIKDSHICRIAADAIEQLSAENDLLKDQNVHANELCQQAVESFDHWKARGEKAEAEVAALKASAEGLRVAGTAMAEYLEPTATIPTEQPTERDYLLADWNSAVDAAIQAAKTEPAPKQYNEPWT